MSALKSREIRLASRPNGTPTPDNFELAEVEVPALQDGQVLIKTHWMSVDPYMRGRMMDAQSYVPPFQIGEVLQGGAIGRVVASKADGFSEGDLVSGEGHLVCGRCRNCLAGRRHLCAHTLSHQLCDVVQTLLPVAVLCQRVAQPGQQLSAIKPCMCHGEMRLMLPRVRTHHAVHGQPVPYISGPQAQKF